jgi:hypothetical protein
MRYLTRFVLALLGVLAATAAPYAQQAPAAAPTLSLPQFIERMVEAEAALMDRLGSYHPVVEVYLQSLAATDDPRLGPVPTRDDYYVGRFDATNGPGLDPLADARGWFRRPGLLNRAFGVTYVPSGFASTTMIDQRAFDTTRYDFAFVRREFLDEVRTVVLEVRPKAPEGGFMGRIWVDDRDFTIVRFNGISREVNTALSRHFRSQLSFHVDSWRVNVQPGVWVPGYVYFEETDFAETEPTPRQLPKLKGQMRLWGYEATDANAPSAFASIELGDAVRDTSEPVRQIAPVLSQRSWEMQAENNVLERLTKAGLLAPPGPVNQVLETVLNNLLVTNELNFDPPLRVRVLLTTPLESFTVGRTIVLSRGLIDVLPDEASLAMVLAHELAHVSLGHLLIDTKFAFADRLMIPDAEVIGALRFQHTTTNEAEADGRLLELLGKSPYAGRLTNAGLFLQQIVLHARELRNLVLPHVGDYVVDGADALGQLVAKAPTLAPGQVDQLAALPLGARITLDPWNNQLELIRTPTVPLVWAREKLPLAITPMVPYLKYTAGAQNSTR